MGENFSQWQRQLFTEAGKGNLEEALELAYRIEKEFPEQKQRTSFWKAALYCAKGDAGKGLSVLQKAEKHGIWWHPDRLLQDPDFEAVRELPEFQEIVERCKEKLASLQVHAKPEFSVWPSSQSSEKPLIFSIHWRGDNAYHFSAFWDDERLKDRFTMAFPQSSQPFGPESFCWDDWNLAKQELHESYQKADQSYNFDRDRLIVAGASQGGKLALELALEENEMPAKGFIAIVLAVREVSQYASLIEKAAARGIRGVIMTGDQDHFYSEVEGLCAEFEKHGMAYKLMVTEGLGHFIPDDFPDQLLEAVDFILDGRTST